MECREVLVRSFWIDTVSETLCVLNAKRDACKAGEVMQHRCVANKEQQRVKRKKARRFVRSRSSPAFVRPSSKLPGLFLVKGVIIPTHHKIAQKTPSTMSEPPAEDDTLVAAVAAAALPPEHDLLVHHPEEGLADDVSEQFWEAPLFMRMETISAADNVDDENPGVSTENILAWSKPQFKGLTVYFSPDYKPSDETSWSKYNILCDSARTSSDEPSPDAHS